MSETKLQPPLELPRNPRRGDRLEVVIDTIRPDGYGVAHVPILLGPQREPRTLAVEVRRAVPGDKLRVDVNKTRRNTVSCRVDEVIALSALRQEARCAHFADLGASPGCGGCTLQSLPYAQQLETKRTMVIDALAVAGIAPDDVQPVLPSPSAFYYRNKMEFSFGSDADGVFSAGLHPAGRKYDVLDLRECHLESEEAVALLDAARRWAVGRGVAPYRHGDDTGFLRTLTIREGKRTGERLVELTTAAIDVVELDGETVDAEGLAAECAEALTARASSDAIRLDGVVWTKHRVKKGERTTITHKTMAGAGVLFEELHLEARKLRFEVHPRAFFQPNTLGAERLYATIIEMAAGQAGSLGRVMDLYCGTGTIGLALAGSAEAVVGVELQKDAVANAARNADRNGVTNITLVAGDVGKVLQEQTFFGGERVDLVIVDPPRSGLMPKARTHLTAISAPRCIYVSCNPVALGRDLVTLQEAGYRVERVQPLDMFPHTAHVETVVLLTLCTSDRVAG